MAAKHGSQQGPKNKPKDVMGNVSTASGNKPKPTGGLSKNDQGVGAAGMGPKKL